LSRRFLKDYLVRTLTKKEITRILLNEIEQNSFKVILFLRFVNACLKTISDRSKIYSYPSWIPECCSCST
jgi:hypothetical protein